MNTTSQIASWVSAFTILLSMGCKKGSPRPKVSSEPKPILAEVQKSRESVVDAYAYEGPSFIKSKQLHDLKSLGPLIREQKTIEPSPFDEGANIEVYTLSFDGLTIKGLLISADSEFVISGLEITTPRWPMKDGLSVGVDAAKIAPILGKPTSIEGKTLIYKGETEIIQFIIKDGKIERILIGYYLG